MRVKLYLILLVIFDIAFLIYGLNTISISYKEAGIFYEQRDFLHYLVEYSTKIFGQNDFALRLPFILFHLGSIYFIYQISKFYLRKDVDRLLVVAVFILLPGVVSSALLVNSASVVIFFTLLFIYLFLRKKETLYSILLPLLVFIDNSFITLYLSLVIYGFVNKNKFLMYMGGMMFLISLYMYGFYVGGKPRGYFLDTFGAYSLIFSPLVFLYFFYTLYRILIKEKKSILWYISFTALIFSIILSFRQRIIIEDFAPFVVVSIPLMLQVFMKSYRIRLPQLRKAHRLFFIFVFAFLIVNFFATYINKYFYKFLDDPTKHFAYKYHVAKELAWHLKKDGFNNIKCNDQKLKLRLRFYGIDDGNEYELLDKEPNRYLEKVTISYADKETGVFYVSKVNK